MSLDKSAGSPSVSSILQENKIKKYAAMLAWFVVLTSLFALAYNQSPLYTSNQNQYFLHGFAQAGYGTLSEDWLANTADPTPVFSLLVASTIRLFHSANLFFIYYAILMGIYIFGLFGIVDQIYPLRLKKLTTLVFITVLILLHATVFRYLIQRLFGGDWPYLFEGGVAGQRLLGPVFQPSTFGVFLLVSIYLYLKDKKSLAVLSAVLAATFHPTYLLSSAALILSYILDTLRKQKKIWPAIRLGIIALVAIAPILIYTFMNFWGGSTETSTEARDILVNIRIPLHAIFKVWFNATVVVKLAFLGAGLFLVRRHRLFTLLSVPLALSIGLTIVQVISKSNALALIFPWRPSTWLVPVSVGLIVGKLVTISLPKLPDSFGGAIKLIGLGIIGLAVTAGIFRTYLEIIQPVASSKPLETFVASHRQVGQQFLMPSKLFDFRLEAGVPIYVDFLSIPYRDADVIEWDRRFSQESFFYQRAACDRLPDFSKEGITHVVLPVDFPVACPQLAEIYSDSAFKLYKLTP